MEVLISPGKGLLDFLGFSVLAWEIFKCFGRGRLVSVLPKIRSYEFAERKGYDFISESLSLFIGMSILVPLHYILVA